MKILLLGYGFLGRYLYRELSKTYEVNVLSNNIPDNPDRNFFLRDFSTLEDDDPVFEGVDMIVHTIHTTVPATSMLNLESDITQNIFPTLRLLSIMEKRKLNKIIYISSGGAVYGNPIISHINEEHPTDPLSGYGISKLAIEKYIQLYQFKGIDHVTLRPSNLFGPNQNLYKPQGIVGHILNALQNDEKIEIWGNGEGKKDYLYVGDLVHAILLTIKYFQKIKNSKYNVASGYTYSVNEILNCIEKEFEANINKSYSEAKKFDVQDVILDGALFRKATGFKPDITIEAFLKKHNGI